MNNSVLITLTFKTLDQEDNQITAQLDIGDFRSFVCEILSPLFQGEINK